MSFISLKKPIKSINTFRLDRSFYYCSDSFSIMLVLKGTLPTDEIVLSAGELLAIPPYMTIAIGESENSYATLFQFSNTVLFSSLDSLDIFARSHNSVSNVSLKAISSLLENIMHAHESSRALSAYYLLIEKINQIFPANSEDLYTIDFSKATKDIITYIAQNIFEPISLNDAATYSGLTPQYISSFIKKTYGITFKEFVNQHKISYCLPLVKYTDLTIDQVAFFTGFSSTSNMENVIHELTDKSFEGLRRSIIELNPIQNIPADLLSPHHQISLFEGKISNVPEAIARRQINLNGLTPHETNESVHYEKKYCAILNLGSADNLVSSEFRIQITEAQAELSYKYGRITNLLDSTIAREVDGHIYYLFDDIFKTLDFLLRLRLIPFISLGNKYHDSKFLPSSQFPLDSTENYHSYYRKLSDILPVFIRNCINRYGKNEVSSWKFELCNDFDNTSSNKQTSWQFLNEYSKFRKIIKDYAPQCQVGGPGFNSIIKNSELRKFLTSAIEHKLTFDFITFTVHSNEELIPGSPICTSGTNFTRRTVSCSHMAHDLFPNAPVYVTEYGFFYDRRNYLNDSIYAACMILWFTSSHYDLVDGFGYSSFSDIATSFNTSNGLLFGGSGIINYLGIKKPSYYAFSFLNKQGALRLNNDPGVIITCNSKYDIQALVYHSPKITSSAASSRHTKEILTNGNLVFEYLEPKTVAITITNTLPGTYLVKEYRINPKSGSMLNEFSKLTDISDFTEADIECLNTLSQPTASISTMTIGQNRILNYPVTVGSVEIVFVQINYNKRR